MDDSPNVLLIFVKNPEEGEVKTRLAETIGDRRALNVYQRLLSITREISDQLTCSRQVWYSKFIPAAGFWDTGNYTKHLQKGSNLGERMKNAFSEAFAGGYHKAVIIGSDCADLKQQIIEVAFDLLDDNDVVIGPSKDGGYYLLGMSQLYSGLFENISWSTAAVFEQTSKIADQLGLSRALLPVLNDIDTEEDLRKAGRNLQNL
ncbi:MAG TPA: TIGR04282 family arsenosugar biosynthesis glycosyltransferase [Balneolaceae bacterium]|nr:TIGR04282 family arsenosugar biosynthesis glycosyltransferase [Balneolaceae bacterium]